MERNKYDISIKPRTMQKKNLNSHINSYSVRFFCLLHMCGWNGYDNEKNVDEQGQMIWARFIFHIKMQKINL